MQGSKKKRPGHQEGSKKGETSGRQKINGGAGMENNERPKKDNAGQGKKGTARNR